MPAFLASQQPYIDENGLLRVQELLTHLKVGGEVKHPPILPCDSWFTSIIAFVTHRNWYMGESEMFWWTCATDFELSESIKFIEVGDVPSDSLWFLYERNFRRVEVALANLMYFDNAERAFSAVELGLQLNFYDKILFTFLRLRTAEGIGGQGYFTKNWKPYSSIESSCTTKHR